MTIWGGRDNGRAARRAAGFLIVGVVLPQLAYAELRTIRIDFSSDPADKAPAEFTSFAGGKGDGGRWIVLADQTSPVTEKVVAQTSARDTRHDHYAILAYNRGVFRKARISTRVKIESSSSDEASAGLAFRYKDPDAYYAFEISSGNGTASLYRFDGGKRELLRRSYILIPRDTWHELVVECDESEAECLLNGTSLFRSSLSQFWKGKVGFWTRADTLARFADLVVLPGEETRVVDRLTKKLREVLP